MAGLGGVPTALALALLAFHARLFALRVQERVIRLEEPQCLGRLLPEDLQLRIAEFTPITLRLAIDEELPVLARKVRNDKVTDAKTLKQCVKRWRTDYLRA